MTLDRLGLLPAHLAWLEVGGLSPNTLIGRGQAVRALGRHAGVDLADVTGAQIGAFLVRTKTDGTKLAQKTRHVYRSHVGEFFAWAVDEELIERDPCRRVPRVKDVKGVPHPIARADLQFALATANPQVRCWLLLGAYAGLRCLEMAALRGEDVRADADPPMLVIARGKGGKSGAVPLHPLLAAELAAWPREGFLFPGPDAGHLRPRDVSRPVNRHLDRCGIDATAHSCRHLFGSSVYAAGHDLLLTQKMLRHANPNTTQGYVQLDPGAAVAVVAGLSYA